MPYFIAMMLARWVLILFFCAGAGVALAATVPAPSPTTGPALSLIAAAEQAVARGDDKTAELSLSRISAGSLDPLQLARVQLVRAEIGLHRGQPQTVLRSLPTSSAHVPSLSARMELLRGRAYFLGGDPVAAVRTLVAREPTLRSAQAVADNREQIWSGLIATPLPARAASAIAGQDPLTRGWLELAAVLEQGPTASALAGWKQRNPAHPGASRAATVRVVEVARAPAPAAAPLQAARPVPIPATISAAPTAPQPAISQPAAAVSLPPVSGSWALLLPVSGNLASSGRAVRDGFVSAWFELPAPRPALRVYDAGSSGAQAATAFETALRDGAGLIVGPLTKDGVSAIARLGRSVPWLALNYVDGRLPGGVQFGLAPEDEARAAALDAAASGHRNALVLIPDNDLGARVFQAFATTFSQQGGAMLQTARFASGTQDFGKPLQALMKLDRSQARHQQVTTALGVASEFEPRPRQDADVLFAPLRTAEARAFVPQLEFFRAARLSTYTLSAALPGTVDRQLNGMRVCDMPWVLDASGAAATTRQRASQQFPEALRDQPRLFALGRDASRLAQTLTRGELNSASLIEGASGRLSMSADGRIARQVGCALVRDGRAASRS
ncbi:MAG: penicillin-binding protein activator [Panacagrimonas sp.]